MNRAWSVKHGIQQGRRGERPDEGRANADSAAARSGPNMKIRHILLLNPPGRKLYTRDYFCSKVTKAGYVEHPLDLLILSGIFSSAGFRVSVLDAQAGRQAPEPAFNHIVSLRPDAVVFLSGLVSRQEDYAFLERLKKAMPRVLFAGMGDLFLKKMVFENTAWMDAVFYDFTSGECADFLAGRRGRFSTISFRDGNDIIYRAPVQDRGEFSIPVPRHDLFLNKGYTFPFARKLPFATVLTDYGCPFSCPFCVYPTLGFRLRRLQNVTEELRYIRSLGIRELFVKDQSFGADRERSMRLCEEMRNIGGFSWTCFLRADVAREDLLRGMKAAGCHTVLFGFESGCDRILRSYKPGVNKRMIVDALRKCRRSGIKSAGIFIFGFPEDDIGTCRETADFAVRCGCDYVSFNVFVPKAGTPLRNKLMPDDSSGEKEEVLDQSGIASVWSGSPVSVEELNRLRVRAIRRFYFRPSYLFGMAAASLFSLCRLRMCLRSAFFILQDVLAKRR